MTEIDAAPNLKRLRAFDAVAHARSLSAAAQVLALSQPALTKSVSALETQLGAKLFMRRVDGSVLTADGEKYLVRVQRFFEQVKEALEKASGEPDVSRRLSILTNVHVRSLIAIWRSGSFRSGADSLGVSEPSLQRPARELEHVLGARLYHKTGWGFDVNQNGAELARRFALAFGELRAGAQEIGCASTDDPSLRIGVLALSPRQPLVRAVQAMLSEGSAQRIEVSEAEYARACGLLQAGDIDVLFGALRMTAADSDLVEEPFFEDPYVVVCRRGHKLAKLSQISLRNLGAFGWVFPTKGIPRRLVLETHLKKWGQKAHANFETSCLATITALLTASDRLTILARSNISPDGPLHALDGLPLSHVSRQIGLTYRRNWLPTPFQRAFLKALRNEAI